MTSPEHQSQPVVTSTARSPNGNFTNIIEGGYDRATELAARFVQGMLLNCMDHKGNHTNPGAIIKLAYKFADALLIEAESREAHAVAGIAKISQETLETEGAQAPQEQSLLLDSRYLRGP